MVVGIESCTPLDFFDQLREKVFFLMEKGMETTSSDASVKSDEAYTLPVVNDISGLHEMKGSTKVFFIEALVVRRVAENEPVEKESPSAEMNESESAESVIELSPLIFCDTAAWAKKIYGDVVNVIVVDAFCVSAHRDCALSVPTEMVRGIFIFDNDRETLLSADCDAETGLVLKVAVRENASSKGFSV